MGVLMQVDRRSLFGGAAALAAVPPLTLRQDALAEVMALLRLSDTRPLTDAEHARLRAAQRRHNGEA